MCQVTLGVQDSLSPGGTYSHIVNAVRVEVSDRPVDRSATAPYTGTDILYIDDHGLYTCSNSQYPCSPTDNTAVPPGAGGASTGCTPFFFGYTFDAWHAPMSDSKVFRIPLPTRAYKNYAYSISGVAGNTRGYGYIIFFIMSLMI